MFGANNQENTRILLKRNPIEIVKEYKYPDLLSLASGLLLALENI